MGFITLNITSGDHSIHNDFEVVREIHCDFCKCHIDTRWYAYCNYLRGILNSSIVYVFEFPGRFTVEDGPNELLYSFCSDECKLLFDSMGLKEKEIAANTIKNERIDEKIRHNDILSRHDRHHPRIKPEWTRPVTHVKVSFLDKLFKFPFNKHVKAF